MINLERFKNEKIAIYCRNQEEWDLILEQLNAENLNQLGLVPNHFDEGEHYHLVLGFDYNKKEKCSNRTQRAKIGTLAMHGWEIVTVQDLMVPDFDVRKKLMELLDNY